MADPASPDRHDPALRGYGVAVRRPPGRVGPVISSRPAPARAPVPGPAPRRRRRWLRRLVVTLLVLVVVGLAGFTWFAYWPFEGRVDRVEALVPADVDFVYRTSWKELRASGWVQRNVVDHPIHPALDPSKVVVGERGETLLRAFDRIPEQEAQINDSIPEPLRALEGVVFGSPDFRVERDLLAGDVVAAGRWCPGGNPRQGPPRWREILLLTRVTPVVKFAFEAVRHDFVRERAVARPDLELTATSDGLLRVELLDRRAARKRETCEGGFEVGPMNVWWVARVKDVIAISNAEDLALKAKALGGGEGERLVDREGFDVDRPDGALAASMDLAGLHSWLNRLFSDESASAGSAFLGKFVAVTALDRASATVQPLDDGVLARAEVRYRGETLRTFKDVAATYDLDPEPVDQGSVLRLIPAKDTALVAQVRTPPRALLRALYGNLSKADQRLVTNRVREIGARRRADGLTGYDDAEGFLDDLAEQVGSTTAVAVARIPSVFTDAMYKTWYLEGDPVPVPAFAFIVRIRDGSRQEDADEFLADRVAALGFRAPEPVTSPDGIQYSRLRMDVVPAEYALYQPAYKVYDRHLVLATREEYLLEVLRVMRGGPGAPPSVAASDDFRATMRALPSKATVAVFVQGDAMRALLWDLRNPMVRAAHDEDDWKMRYQARRVAEIGRANGGRVDLTPELQERLRKDVAEEMERFRTEGYAQFVAEFRRDLDATRRVAAAGLVLAADRANERVDAGVRLLLRPPEDR